jgi:UDP-N-acetylmuramoylalanine-D-glutamate ligase
MADIGPGERNHLVFHDNFEDFPDATTVVFKLQGQLYMTAYIDIDNALLDRFVKKYGLDDWWQMEGDTRQHYPFSEFYTTGAGNGTIARIPNIPS